MPRLQMTRRRPAPNYCALDWGAGVGMTERRVGSSGALLDAALAGGERLPGEAPARCPCCRNRGVAGGNQGTRAYQIPPDRFWANIRDSSTVATWADSMSLDAFTANASLDRCVQVDRRDTDCQLMRPQDTPCCSKTDRSIDQTGSEQCPLKRRESSPNASCAVEAQ